MSGEFVREQRPNNSVGMVGMHSLQVVVNQTNVAPRRTNSVSASSLSAVHMMNDKNHVLFSSWDNNIYGSADVFD